MRVTVFITALVLLPVLTVLIVPLAGQAQQTVNIPRIGLLSGSSPSDSRWQSYVEAFRAGLRELGYVESRNIAIESRWAEGKRDRLPSLAAELVRLKVDVIVTSGLPAIRAAQEATGTIPIVMAGVLDPVASGLIASYARPGGNITGISTAALDLVRKQLEILKEVVPKVSRVSSEIRPTLAMHYLSNRRRKRPGH